MVSLEDSQIPPLSSQNPCSPSRIQRSHGRSMRTIRSNLYHTDSRNPSPKPGNSTAVSENLTDSVVDFRLRELAVGYSAAKPVSSMASADAADLLDLSHDFSDFSSFDSDISGELHRLAVAHSFQPLSTPGSPAYDGDGEDLLDLGLGFWAESLVSSSEILENASPESLEPVIAACVECLKSSSASIETKRDAAAKVRLLARHRSDFRTLIGSTGAIPALVPLLRSADSAAQENAATALFNLSLEDSNRLAIAGAGAVKPLVYALRTGTVAAKQNAACAILRLSMAEENRAGIGASGAIPALVALLRGGTSRGKKDALTALYKLCSGERRNKERAVEAGAAAPLVALVAERGGGTAEKAVVVLGSLAEVAEGREAIVGEGGIVALVEAMEEGSARGKELALAALLQLCSDSARNRNLLLREGVIPPLVALSQSGSARAKRKAEALLGYLREERQGGAT
ncbi:U-box domain-containing protein 4 [Elaeis guineensis]|uniref:U-box domain-containing protein 4 isoform X1 n=1 Tax=Elaeis guineensis var. tenera TaxID=51953 RepID=A0A6I9QDW5_ELAGV|nr:U-box domain-containing protein 4 isoform X1 [Elaeis guineensis]XP_010907753.1 U-box domain-containing protein 4 isoform X1 [Elaeis guineensis]XP_010907758.1 U-box domain-containing protein 4 isoform X1 [Elaeis guineensis]XP_019702446.1 U-box domain-containing protein 4 isoform X2 [Elaeis guineensis]